MRLDGAAGGGPDRVAVGGLQRQQLGELGAQVVDAAAVERREMPQPLRVLVLETGCDLRETRVARDERRAAGGRRLRGDHPERLREDRRHDRRVGERQEMHEVAMLQRPREEHTRAGSCLELPAVVAKADDHGACVERAQSLEQKLHALVLDQLAEVDDRRLVSRMKNSASRAALPSSGSRSFALPGVRRVTPRLLEQLGQRLAAILQHELVDVDARRHFDHPVDMADHVLEHLADVTGADECRVGCRERLLPPRLEPRAPAHRILELRSVRLDAEAHAARRSHRGTHQHVVCEDEVGRAELAQRSRIRLDVARTFVLREVLQQPRLEPVVAVEDEHRQQPRRAAPGERPARRRGRRARGGAPGRRR